MSDFAWGLGIGWTTTLIAAAVAAVVLHRRFIVLERRTRRAEHLAELGTLTGGLAHEIKNPLSTVQLNLQLLQEDLDPRVPGYQRIVNRLTTVRGETSRLREILDDFLRYAGRLELDQKSTELNALIEQLVDFFSPQARLSGVQIRFRRTAQPVLAMIDAKLIKQTLLNLLLNATQAMPTGGDLIVQLEVAGQFATISVIDTGPGIDVDRLAKIFDAYYTTKRGGTGLGLAMSRRIAVEHGGKLEAFSEVGKGSHFELTLPLV